jgi:hypothetical protein
VAAVRVLLDAICNRACQLLLPLPDDVTPHHIAPSLTPHGTHPSPGSQQWVSVPVVDTRHQALPLQPQLPLQTAPGYVQTSQEAPQLQDEGGVRQDERVQHSSAWPEDSSSTSYDGSVIWPPAPCAQVLWGAATLGYRLPPALLHALLRCVCQSLWKCCVPRLLELHVFATQSWLHWVLDW